MSNYLDRGFILPSSPEALSHLYTFEKTPRYMLLADTQVKLMHDFLPSVKLLSILRNPRWVFMFPSVPPFHLRVSNFLAHDVTL